MQRENKIKGKKNIIIKSKLYIYWNMLTEHQRELSPHVTNRLAYMLLIFIITCLYYYTQNISIIYLKNIYKRRIRETIRWISRELIPRKSNKTMREE